MDEGVEDAVIQPVRLRILTLLAENVQSLYIEQIAKSVGESSRLTAHHLEILEDMGLVRSEFGIVKEASRPVAGRFFVLTPKADEALGQLRSSLPKVRKNE
jgi:DNA-binding transcriptional ArsR family regulator